MQLSKELHQLIDEVAPLIVFFSLSAQQQTKVLPILEKEEMYDFPDGDLWTSSALEVLAICYQTFMSAISLRLMLVLDEISDENTENLANVVDQLLNKLNKIVNWHRGNIFRDDNLDSPEWGILRQFSQVVREELHIQLEVSKTMLRNHINYRLHC
jgi:hypothetical protein